VDEAKNRLIAPNCIRLLGLLNASQALGQKRLVENSAKKREAHRHAWNNEIV
jgi:hypothetical protein